MSMSDDGQTAPHSPSEFSNSSPWVNLAHRLLVVRWDCEGGLAMRKLMARQLFWSCHTWYPSFPPFRLAELTRNLGPSVLELREFDPKQL